MLELLSIRDLVLIERADLALPPGLVTLTGETGAGKSILLDGLGLALGGRAEAAMVRRGAPRATVAATFRVDPAHPAAAFLGESGIEPDESGAMLLRRQVGADGGSRAFVNDQPVTVGTLRALGALLVEIHGQHDERGLLNPRGHMALLDLYGGHGALLADVQAAHAAVVAARAAAAAARAQAEADLREREWLEHAAAELSELAPEPGEEERLATLRTRMQKDARLTEALAQVGDLVTGSDGALARLRQAARRLERLGVDDAGFAAVLAAVDRALVAGDEIESGLEAIAHRALVSPDALEAAETRLFALRAAARKHRVGVDELSGLAAELSARLQTIAGAEGAIARLDAARRAAAAALDAKAALLSQARAAAAARLDAAVNAELPALKLSSARFRTALSPAEPGPAGADRVAFEVATNRAAEFGPLTRIASGGELSRFVLALKVALAGAGVAGTLIFDEIDRGVGGAVASAIGDRLARLGGGENGAQLLVVTHSPQVAAAGAAQYLIEKGDSGAGVRTAIRLLSGTERVEEVARMLSGAAVTAEARAQARRLLAAGEAGGAAGA